MHPAVAPLKHTVDLDTRLFVNCLDGMSEQQALERPGASANHVAFLAAHLVEARYFIARALGLQAHSPFKEILEGAKGIDDIEAFPSLDAIRAAWSGVSGRLSERLESLDENSLSAKAPARFPIEGGDTILGCLTFLVQHDAYHIGQLALLRRQIGLEPMSYR
jgi:uncharacterized damage-inducible protein DinB